MRKSASVLHRIYYLQGVAATEARYAELVAAAKFALSHGMMTESVVRRLTEALDKIKESSNGN